MLPACVLAAACAAACPPASASEQQATFTVAVRLHSAAKIPSARELCVADAPLEASSLRMLGAAVRVDCPAPTAGARTTATRITSGAPARPREVMVSF